MAGPRGATLQTVLRKQRFPGQGDFFVTETIDATNTVEVISIANPGKILAYQAKGTLEASVEVSLTGVDYVSITPNATTNLIQSYDVAPIRYIRFTRVSGEGQVVVTTK